MGKIKINFILLLTLHAKRATSYEDPESATSYAHGQLRSASTHIFCTFLVGFCF